MEAILKVKDLGIAFGGNKVLDSVNFYVNEGEVLGIMGPNGAGKTVLLNIISGILKADHGEVIFLGQNILKESITARTAMGIGRTFQVPRAFEHMSVYENILASVVYGQKVSEKAAAVKAKEILKFVKLEERANEPAGKLRLINRKRLEIGAALASDPKLLLLDEVAGGLTNAEVNEILEIVKTIKGRGVSIIWIEHIIQTLMEGTDRIMLLANGRDLLTDTPEEVMKSSIVNEVYMGAEEDD
ncbi:MAG: ATP-binding cassette domain-containing protein [Lachnospiraceae bacterium]|nr:ATP-binding cassette domain-containing protein [Lachnospiraceae bacterium]